MALPGSAPQIVLSSLAIAILASSADGLFIKKESYYAVNHSTCGPEDSYRVTEFMGCSDIEKNGTQQKSIPFSCTEVDDPFLGKYWTYSNVSLDNTTGIFSVNFGSCKEPTCTDFAQCTRESYPLAGGNVTAGDIFSGSNCSLSSKRHGYFVRYSVVSGDVPKKMVADLPPKTALLRSCLYNTSSVKRSLYEASLCADDWTMWPVHEQCFFQAKNPDAGSSKTTCEPAEQAVYMTQWTSSDTCQGPPFEEKYYKDQAKSCAPGGMGFYVESCRD